jgi:hypothetical protein
VTEAVRTFVANTNTLTKLVGTVGSKSKVIQRWKLRRKIIFGQDDDSAVRNRIHDLISQKMVANFLLSTWWSS